MGWCAQSITRVLVGVNPIDLLFRRLLTRRGGALLAAMAWRDEYEQEFRDWLRAVGRRLGEHSRSLDLTQAEAADRCAMDLKQYQDIEYGRRPLSLRTAYVLGRCLRLDSGEWLAAGEQVTVGLRLAGWQTAIPGSSKAIPVYGDMVAAGVGAQGGGNLPVAVEYLRPPRTFGRNLPAELGWFIGQALGNSMIPLAVDGEWCLFRKQVEAPIVGKTVLVGGLVPRKLHGDELQLKRVGALEALGAGLRLRLDSLATGCAPEWREAANLEEFKFVGEFVEVLAPVRSPAQRD